MNAMAPKILLAVVTVSTICGVGYVHHRQNMERAEMYEGVKRDLERQRAAAALRCRLFTLLLRRLLARLLLRS